MGLDDGKCLDTPPPVGIFKVERPNSGPERKRQMAHNVSLENPVFEVSLPKKAGKVQINAVLIPDAIIGLAVEHGFRQKLADIAVNMFVRDDRKNPKDGDKLYDTPEELAKAIHEEAVALMARWAGGEWNREGGATRSDPVGGEVWSILFATLEIPTNKRADAKKLGQEELALQFAELKGIKRPKGKDAAAKLAANVLAKVRARAEQIVASRAMELEIDI